MFPPHLCRSTYILQPALPVSHVARGILLWSEPLRFALIRFAVARAVTRRFRVITALRRTDRFWPHAADNLTGSVRPRPCGNVKSALSARSRAFEIATSALCATVGLTDLIEVVLKVALRMRLAARLPPFILPGDGALCPHCLHQRSDAHDLHDAFEVVGQHMEAHFGADARQPLGQEMRRAHPGFERAEGMFDGLPA